MKKLFLILMSLLVVVVIAVMVGGAKQTQPSITDFIDRFVAAYNASDVETLKGMIADKNEYQRITRASKRVGQHSNRRIRISIQNVEQGKVAIVSATLFDNGNSTQVVLHLSEGNNGLELVKSVFPATEQRNAQLKEAGSLAMALESAINESNTNAVLKIVGLDAATSSPEPQVRTCLRARNLEWIADGLECKTTIGHGLNRVRRFRDIVFADFIVSDKCNATNSVCKYILYVDGCLKWGFTDDSELISITNQVPAKVSSTRY